MSGTAPADRRSERTRIGTCVCTYKRPLLLRQLLWDLVNQRTDDRFTLSIVVVDNDAQRSAESVVARFCRTTAVRVTYAVEEQQNIALARNKAVALADGDLLAFIDDDERPPRDWLLRLLDALSTYQADGILAPVNPLFAVAPPAWIVRSRIFERPSPAEGTVLDWPQTRTGNVLLRRSALEGLDGPFRAEFGSGGEDRDLFRRAIARGRRFVWSRDGAVQEIIPPERTTRRVLLRRALLRGRASLAGPGSRRGAAVTATAAVALYALLLPIGLLRGQHIFMTYLIRTCDHLGKLLAMGGIRTVKESYILTGQATVAPPPSSSEVRSARYEP